MYRCETKSCGCCLCSFAKLRVSNTTNTNLATQKVEDKTRKGRIKRKLFNPSTARRYEDHFPSNINGLEHRWKPKERDENSTRVKLTQKDAMELSGSKWSIVSNHHELFMGYPAFNYLSLRYDQNITWANERFTKGVLFAKQALEPTVDAQAHVSLMRKAETCYKEGLDLIPHHPPLLCAYGALCANEGRYDVAKQLLQDAIRYGEEDGQTNDKYADAVRDAKMYLGVVHSKENVLNHQIASNMKKYNANISLSTRAEKVMNDVQAERDLQLETLETDYSRIKSNDRFPLLSSSSDESSSYERRKKRKRRRKKEQEKYRKKHSHRKRKRKSQKYYSDDDHSDSASDRDHRHRKRRSRRKDEDGHRHRRRSKSSDSSG